MTICGRPVPGLPRRRGVHPVHGRRSETLVAQAVAQLHRGQRDDERGFTLIELMVVVLIIAILIAIAIPTFLGTRGKAKTRQAQSNLRNAFTASKTVYSDTQS